MMLAAAQPILDKQLNVVARELYFRDQDPDRAIFENADSATSQLLLNAFTSLTTDEDLDTGLAFVNVTPTFLATRDALLDKPNTKLVYKLQVKDITDVDECVALVSNLREKGHKFALAGLTEIEQLEPFEDLLEFVKVNISSTADKDVRILMRHLKSFQVQAIAEHIENFTQLESCIELGFQLFQGFFLSKPRVVSGENIEASASVVLSLVQELYDPETNADRLEEIVVRDVGLTLKLLRISNSAIFGFPQKVESVKDAIVVIGLDMMRHWSVLIAMANLKPKSPAQFYMQLVRAKMCENIATINQLERPKSYFLAGLLSCLDAILDVKMDTVLAKLTLSDDIQIALTDRSGSIGEVLENVICYERSDWGSLEAQELAEAAYGDAYFSAMEWANELLSSLK